MELLIRTVSWQHAGILVTGDVRISNDLISETGVDLPVKAGEQVLDLPDHFIYPGLINAHDHLEMNLYPRMGHPLYNNYIEWSKDVYKPTASPVKEIEKVNIEDRLLWGGLKSLISGATTVVHHNPWNKLFEKKEFPVRVLKKFTWVHSLAFGKNIKQTFPTDNAVPFVIHAGEGIDDVAAAEIETLHDLGVLRKNTVLIHAVGVTSKNMALMEQERSSIVWCPASNDFMFAATAPIRDLKNIIRVTLGTDSTMSGSSTLLEEMRFAEHTGKANADEILKMVTVTAREVFNLSAPEIRSGCPADFFITPKKSDGYAANLLATSPENILLTSVNGTLRLVDSIIKFPKHSLKHCFHVNGREKYTDTDVAGLKKRIVRKTGEDVLSQSALWKLIDA